MNGPHGDSTAGEAHRRVGEDGRVAAAEAFPGKEYDGIGHHSLHRRIHSFFCRSS